MTRKAMLDVTTAVTLIAMSSTIGIDTASAQGTPAAGEATAQAPDIQTAAVETAQEGPNLGQEIIVTARRREENLMKVPVAVAVMSEADIQNTGVKNLQELSQFTPGLFSQAQNSGIRNDRGGVRLTFRGLSTASGTIFIDGAPYSGAGQPDITDVARIEVLKGPQSVYFGRATFSGAVNYVTQRPGNEFRGRVNADFSSFDGADGRLMVEGPLIGDLLSARVSVRGYTFGGQYKNGLTRRDLGERTTRAVSVALASSPSDKINLSAYYSYQLDDDGPTDSYAIKIVGPGPTLTCNLGGTGGPYWCGELPKLSDLVPSLIGGVNTLDPFTRSELIDNARGYPVLPFRSDWLDHYGLKRLVHHGHFRADFSTNSGWEAAILLAYSRTKLSQLTSQERRDTTFTPNPFHPTGAALAAACAAAQPGPLFTNACFTPASIQLTTFNSSLVNDGSAELRISSPQDKRVRGTIGASYYRVWGPPGGNRGIQNNGRLINGGGGGLDAGVSTPAVFGGLYFDATDRLKLSAEARYQWDGISQQQVFPILQPQLKGTFRSFSPRVTADFQITPRSLLYATWSRGYRPGGFNAGLLGLTPAVLVQLAGLGTNIAFEQEKLDNYELGHKATWFDNRLRTTVAAYHMSYTNGQVANQNFFTNANGSTASVTVISNVGRIRLQGIELEADFAATRNLKLTGSLGYADNKILAYVYTPNGLRIRNSTNVDGNQTDQVPKLTISLSPTYTRNISGNWDVFTRVDYSYRSKIFIDPTNVAWLGARHMVNAHFGFTNGSALRIEGYVKNLFNDDTLLEANKGSESHYAPNATCTAAVPTCYNPALPLVVSPGVSVLNSIGIALPVKRTFGVRASYEF